MISVCIASYNGEKYIKTQLTSILHQLDISDEVIISDDGSTDNTIEVIESLEDPRIIIYKNNFKNVVKNFEFAIKKSKGDYIFLSDQDDIWNPKKVEVCLKDFNNGYDLVLSDCSIFEADPKRPVEDSFFQFNKSNKGILRNIIKNSYIGCCMAFSKEVKEKILPFPSNLPMHDSWIGLIGEIYFKVNFNPEKLVLYRRHSANASDTGSGRSKYSLFRKIGFRISLIYNLTLKHFHIGKN